MGGNVPATLLLLYNIIALVLKKLCMLTCCCSKTRAQSCLPVIPAGRVRGNFTPSDLSVATALEACLLSSQFRACASALR